MKKLILVLLLVFFFGVISVTFNLPKPVRAQTNTIYYFDASSYYLDRWGYCMITPGTPCGFNIFPPDRPPSKMTADFDQLMTLTSIQGLVNRDGPVLWLKINTSSRHDNYLWDKFRDGTKPYGFLSNYNIVTLNSFEEVLSTFKNNQNIKGSVSYRIESRKEGSVILGNGAGLNVASTAAGADSLVINRQGSVIYDLVKSYFPEQIQVPYFEHKPDAYRWAINNYLKTGKSNPQLIAWLLDAWPLVLYQQGVFGGSPSPDYARDNLILKKAFFFDLTPWSGERPADDLRQPCGDDERVFGEILQEARNIVNSRQDLKNKMINLAGYPPWPWKYFGDLPIFSGDFTKDPASHRIGDIDSCQQGGKTSPTLEAYWEGAGTFLEEKFVQFISQYGAYDAGFSGDLFSALPSNMSVMNWGKLPKTIANPPPPARNQLIQKGYLTTDNRIAQKTYVLAYFGDYEQDGSTVTMDSFFPYPWSQGRGTIPAVWGINPVVIENIPGFISYLLSTRTNQDFFAAPFGAAGYVYPNFIPSELLPWWKKHNGYFYSQLNLQQSLVAIANGNHNIVPPTNEVAGAYASFSPQGMVTFADVTSPRMLFSIPAAVYRTAGMASGATKEQIANDIDANWQSLSGGLPKFLVQRNTWYGPSVFKEALDFEKSRHPERNYEVVDPYTFFYLLRLNLGGNNDNKATYTIDDSFPQKMISGQQYTVKIHARNDGWNSWYGNGHPSCSPAGQPWKVGCFRLGAGFSTELPEPVIGEPPKFDYNLRAELERQEILPGETYEYNLTLTAPTTPGEYYLRTDIVKELNYWFETMGNLPLIRKITVVPATIIGDLNSDGKIDIFDYNLLIQNFGNTTCNNVADIDGNCRVDIFDYNILVGNFGK